ncbi:MAG: hypothetical protein KAR16_15505 [Bacteroidales bacterium]|nr:hypothetical protein [Bacteroidales bacterium]
MKLKVIKLKVVKSIKSVKSLGSLKAVIAIILALTMISMVQSDRKERVQECASKAGEGAIYLKEFVVSLPKGVKDEAPPVYRQAVILRGNNIYRFNLCNDKGQAIIRIYDNTNMVVSSYDTRTKKEYNPINFLCRKTGQYTIMINFRDGKAGEAVGIMSHVMK